MATAPTTTALLRSFDEHGHAIRLTPEQVRERNKLALESLDAIREIGDDQEQRETLEYLIRVIDEDRLSNRPRFGS